MNTPLLYNCVPIAPSKTTTCCGSRSLVISGFSGNGGLCFRGSARRGAAHGGVLRFGVVNYDRGGRLFREELERLREVHAQCFLRWKELEYRGVIVEIRARAVAPRISLSARHAQLVLDPAMRPLRHRFGGFD